MIKTINFSTNLYKEDLFTKFKIKQDDTVNFKITVEDAPVNFNLQRKAKILLRRSDNTVVYEEINVTITDKLVSFRAPNGTTRVAGLTYGELEFNDIGDTVGSTFYFVFDVVARAGNIKEAIESKDEIFIIDEIRQFITQVKEDLKLLDTNITEVKKQQALLDTKMESTTSKVNELKAQVDSKDLNVAELKKENTKATQNIQDLRNINTEALKTKEDLSLLKGTALSEIEAVKTGAISSINTNKDEAISIINTTKTGALNLINSNKEEALSSINNSKEEAIESFTTTANNAKNALDLVVEESKNILNNLNNKGIEATEWISVINTLIENGEALKTSLENNIAEGNPINEEMARLIEEAKNITIPALKAYINANTGGGSVDLTEVFAKIEELNAKIEELNVKIEELNVKTEEVNVKIEELNVKTEEVNEETKILNTNIDNLEKRTDSLEEKTDILEKKTEIYKGKIGEEKHPVFYSKCPRPAEDEEHYIRYYDELKKRYRTVYIKEGYFVHAYIISKNTNKATIRLKAKTSKKYILYDYDETTSEWILRNGSESNNLTNAESHIYIELKDGKSSIYSSSFDVFESSALDNVFIPAMPGDPYSGVIGTYNITDNGLYYVEHMNSVEGCVKDEFKGSLLINSALNITTQTLIENTGEVFVRVLDNSIWSDWKEIGGKVDLSNYLTKEETEAKINELIGAPKALIIEKINNIIDLL